MSIPPLVSCEPTYEGLKVTMLEHALYHELLLRAYL